MSQFFNRVRKHRRSGGFYVALVVALVTMIVTQSKLSAASASRAGNAGEISGLVQFQDWFASTYLNGAGKPSFSGLLLNGIDEERKPDTTLTLTGESAPAKLYVEQNVPNPFRTSTVIRYGLPQSSWVKVTIHNMLGTPIKTIVNEPQKAGVYQITLVEPDLQPGIYFYRIQTELGTQTRRMTVSK